MGAARYRRRQRLSVVARGVVAKFAGRGWPGEAMRKRTSSPTHSMMRD
jgi:hypothetical protein